MSAGAAVPDLAALSEAATPGPWVVAVRSDGSVYGIDNGGGYDDVIAPGPVNCMAYCYGGSSTVTGDRLNADAAYIAALVNAHRAGLLVPRSEVVPVAEVRALAEEWDAYEWHAPCVTDEQRAQARGWEHATWTRADNLRALAAGGAQ